MRTGPVAPLAQVKSPRKGLSKVNYNRYGYFFVFPFVVVFIIFQLYPIFFTFRTSLSDAVGWEKINSSVITGIQSYRLFFDPGSVVFKEFWMVFGNTLLIWIVNFIPQIVMACCWPTGLRTAACACAFRAAGHHFHAQHHRGHHPFIPVAVRLPVAPVNTLLQQTGICPALSSGRRKPGHHQLHQFWMWYGFS